ncbi:hypothetical protein MMC10_002830 [Thelotrema lepadinum]|nr:hypothetical protein [Thelotrema lepadinum]
MKPEENLDSARLNGNNGSKRLQQSLDQLSRRIANMKQLKSLSIQCAPTHQYLGSWITRSSLSHILKSLPETVRNLEVDTRGYENTQARDDPHLCPLIRRVIPQLQHLRLRFANICPDLCGTGYDRDNPSTVADAFKLVKGPNLEQCVINIHLPGKGDIHYHPETCGVPQSRLTLTGDDSTPSIRHLQVPPIKHLQSLVSPDKTPRLHKLWILDGIRSTQILDAEFPHYHAFVRRDILASRSRDLPYWNIGGSTRDGYVIRMPDSESGSDYVSFFWAIEDLAEGQT